MPKGLGLWCLSVKVRKEAIHPPKSLRALILRFRWNTVPSDLTSSSLQNSLVALHKHQRLSTGGICTKKDSCFLKYQLKFMPTSSIKRKRIPIKFSWNYGKNELLLYLKRWCSWECVLPCFYTFRDWGMRMSHP